MAVYDLEEQEQIDEIKAWWQQYRKLVLLVVVAAAVTVGGIQGWRYYHNKQALEAGELYLQLQGAVGGGDQKKVQDIAVLLVEKYPRTGYAVFAAFAGAKAAFDGGDAAGAKARLQWVVDNGKDDETRDIARLRLAAVLLDEKKFDEALRLLETKHADTLSALYADLKGDVLMAQGKAQDARGAYQLALDKSEAKSAYRALIQIKLDALGGVK
ncbi:MAG: tetratricopeptide repeat protein [Betaproteobacteria bacterium]|nr:tetratricopeptide repeat protein [Betaproteobacteria bacterium]